MYTTDEIIVQDIADALRVNIQNLPAWWQGVISRCHVSAYQDIYGRLLARGYTPAQIAGWDRGEEFERAISLYFAFTTPQAIGTIDQEALRVFDRRKEVDHVLVSVKGVWLTPGDTPGVPGVGRESTQNDIFSWPSPGDPGLGRPTRW